MLNDKNRDELIQIMAENGLTPAVLPDLLGYSKSTVDAWMMPDRNSPRARPVTDRALDTLKLKIEAAKANLNK